MMAENFLTLSAWYFLSNTTWWIILAVAMVVTTLPSLLKSLRIVPLLLIIALWFSALFSMLLISNIWAALAGAAISLFWGLLLMVASLIFSGVRQMANKRYG
jgi:hypothetical protein